MVTSLQYRHYDGLLTMVQTQVYCAAMTHLRIRLFVVLLGISLLQSSCASEPKAPSDETQAVPPAATLSKVNKNTTNVLFRYQTKDGFQTATAIDDIPIEARPRVHVIDLSKSPKARHASTFVQVFDLTKTDPSGYFVGQLVPRSQLETALEAVQKRAPPAKVTMYSAAWCGVCTKARKFMTTQGIPFGEKDIDKDRGAKDELAKKARAAGIRAGGVPVFDIAGKMISGFDPNRILALLGRPNAK